eukprot:TRINITY_DN705_c0_g1_i14.p1 TRINITY_DN705_c0_g1~~TRINITY_DN705_c0_g1_i14.p1  ORF type:complete len:162 (+),score=55.74 TRINITY_DN705_c0_g1_i14:781-1266(+)
MRARKQLEETGKKLLEKGLEEGQDPEKFKEFQRKLKILENSNSAYQQLLDFTKPLEEYRHYIEWLESFCQLQKIQYKCTQAHQWLEEDERSLQRRAKNMKAACEQEVGDFLLSKEVKEKQLNELRVELAERKKNLGREKKRRHKEMKDPSGEGDGKTIGGV